MFLYRCFIPADWRLTSTKCNIVDNSLLCCQQTFAFITEWLTCCGSRSSLAHSLGSNVHKTDATAYDLFTNNSTYFVKYLKGKAHSSCYKLLFRWQQNWITDFFAIFVPFHLSIKCWWLPGLSMCIIWPNSVYLQMTHVQLQTLHLDWRSLNSSLQYKLFQFLFSAARIVVSIHTQGQYLFSTFLKQIFIQQCCTFVPRNR